MIERRFVAVGERLVHYRTAGSGPALLMVHQSPRSSAEYDALIAAWAMHFTVIAPDTPGFGQSDPLPPGAADPEVEDYADAVVDLLDALGLASVGAYGFHSGAIILITAAKRHPGRFAAIAANGYAVWLPEERAVLGERYTPAFVPQPYGEHLVWAWNRMLEQSWFFPWYDTRDAARLRSAHDDPAAVHPWVIDLLASGDAYRLGYAAVLRANRDLPPADAPSPPVLLTAADADPLQAHLARLGILPLGWRVQTAPTRAEADALCLDHLLRHTAPATERLPSHARRGFARVATSGFDGLLHWIGDRGADTLTLHAPGRAAALVARSGEVAIDLPGHGLSDDGPTNGDDLDAWVQAVAALVGALDLRLQRVVGEGWSALLACAVAHHLGLAAEARDGVLPHPSDTARWQREALPDLTPDRFGGYLVRAWAAVRARQLFCPSFNVGAANAIPFHPAALAPDRLRQDHLAAIQARSGQRLLDLLATQDRDALLAAPVQVDWRMLEWARLRADVWRPKLMLAK